MVCLQRLAWRRLSFLLGATQCLPLRRPATDRVKTIRTDAACDREKSKLVPSGTRAFAEIAVARLDALKREWRRRAWVIVGATRGAGGPAIETVARAVLSLPSTSAPVTVTV